MEFITSNGTVIEYRRVPTMLAAQLMKQFPEPRPPKQEVDLGGVKEWQENVVDPDYLQARREHSQMLEERLRRLIIKRGVIHELTKEELEAVHELREFWQQEYGVDLPGSNLEVWVNYIALQTPEDVNRLLEEVTAASQPTAKSDNRDNQSLESDL